MRKPNYNGKGPGKGKPFKRKEGEKNFKKPGSRGPNTDKARGSDEVFKGRKARTRSEEDKPRRNFSGSDERSSYKKRDESPAESGRGPSGRKIKPRSSDEKPRRSFDTATEKPAFKKDSRKENTLGRDKFSERKSKPRSFEDKPRRNFENSEERTSFNKGLREERPAGNNKKSQGSFDSSERRKGPGRNFDSNARKYATPKFNEERTSESNPIAIGTRKKEGDNESTKRVKFDDFEDGKVFSNTTKNKAAKPSGNKTKYKKQTIKSNPQTGDGLTRLNKYLANAGVASRREADTLIQSGVVKVNGVVVDQLGYKISSGDKVTYGDAPVRGERKVYLLLNKPKDYITTVDDPQERKTVMELVSKACRERIYPVGRLDRNTTGLLLFTNDGEMTTKLTHPKFGVKKVYHVSLNKGLKPDDFKAISEGLELEDGIVKVDDLAFVGDGKKEIGIEIHNGRNRIVRRIFEHLGYDVIKLDRVVFAGLTKKDLPRGKHRFLTAKEIGFLQMIG